MLAQTRKPVSGMGVSRRASFESETKVINVRTPITDVRKKYYSIGLLAKQG